MFLDALPSMPGNIIAGRHAGKPVSITPQAEPIYSELVKLSRQGNYWAQITVKGIAQLAAGRLHQNNIFVKPGATHRSGTEEFVVILPGCRVAAEKLPNDSFKILHFEADLHYGELIKNAERPGLYTARKTGDRWQARWRTGGIIEQKEDRVVAIGDSGHGEPARAADSVAASISQSPLSSDRLTLEKGFEMHFTPGKKRVGGFVNFRKAVRPLENEDLHESALLLARTMYAARDIKDVRWVAEFGGSAVLTQAMRMLADQGAQLPGHHVFLVRPTSSPDEALKAAQAVGIQLDRNFSKTGMLDYIGNRDQLELICRRRRHGEKGYTLLNAATDIVLTGKNIHGAVGFIAGAGAVSGLSMSAPAAAAFLTALGSAAAAVVGMGKLGKTATEAWLPKQYNKLKSKF